MSDTPPSAKSVKIAPSILSADFGRLADDVAEAEAGGADWVHVDVMDGQFVPNITLGPPVVSAIRKATGLPLDVHLMITDPSRFIGAFRDVGADYLTIHLEADRHPHRTLTAIAGLGAGAGLALNPGTPVAAASELVDLIDLLVVMSVNPGFGGQEFIPSAVRKLERAQQLLARGNRHVELEVDGGVKAANAADVARAGATVVVAGSYIFDGRRAIRQKIGALRRAVDPDRLEPGRED